jgi:eukaryotic-like serine/threonine-protein kinase
MANAEATSPRILILESDEQTRNALRSFTVKSWPTAAVQAHSTTLHDTLADPERLGAFDVVLVGCDFAAEAIAEHSTLKALRAASADPSNPVVILLTEHGSEFTAVQAMKSGAFDYVPKRYLSREQLAGVVRRALRARKAVPTGAADATSVKLFGYDVGRRLAVNRNIAVYVAYSAERGGEVVLKVLHRGRGSLAHDEDFEQLIGEFKRLYDIADPAVAEIYDFRVTAHYCYIAMEYFPLGHLGLKLTGVVDVTEALAVTEEIARALSIIHAAGVIHRDLKPANIMLREEHTVALIDFGIAQSAAKRPTDIKDKQITGTPYYMSPEQARGQPTDERTDLYALGVILYQMLTGEKPYVGETTQAILEQHCTAPLPHLPEPLAHYQLLLDRLLAKQPSERLSGARELMELIERTRGSGHAPDYGKSAAASSLKSA